MSEINSLPGWARVMHKPLEMVTGSDFNPGDTVYFSARAYPRILWKKLSATSWSVMEWRGDFHKPGRISIDPGVCYVVKRAATSRPAVAPVPDTRADAFFLNRPLTSIRVEGEHLAVGDVVYLDVHRKKAEILEIGAVYTSLMRGIARDARLHFLDLEKVAPYTFSGFRIVPPFVVVAGPKFAAARRDPALIFWREGVHRWHCKG